MSRTGLFSRLQRLESPPGGTRVTCLSVDAQGGEHFLWEVPCPRPSHLVTIKLPPGGADPIISLEDMNDETT